MIGDKNSTLALNIAPVYDGDGGVEGFLQEVELKMNSDEPVNENGSHLGQNLGLTFEIVRSDVLDIFDLAKIVVDVLDVFNYKLRISSVLDVYILNGANVFLWNRVSNIGDFHRFNDVILWNFRNGSIFLFFGFP